LGLRGDGKNEWVVVQRAGDVIPQVVRKVPDAAAIAIASAAENAAETAATGAGGNVGNDDDGSGSSSCVNDVSDVEEGGNGDALSSLSKQVFPSKQVSTSEGVWEMPSVCPSCGAAVFLGQTTNADAASLSPPPSLSSPSSSSVVAHYCSGGMACSAQAVERLAHFVSRSALNLGGLGRAKLKVVMMMERVMVMMIFFATPHIDSANQTIFCIFVFSFMWHIRTCILGEWCGMHRI
jgi:NAD-dependent DNA ligase